MGSVLYNYFKNELPSPAQFQTATGKSPATTDSFVTYSEEEALGLTPKFYYGEPDGFIGLSSAVSWNTTDTSLLQTGSNGGGYDAVGAAASEIGEVLAVSKAEAIRSAWARVWAIHAARSLPVQGIEQRA